MSFREFLESGKIVHKQKIQEATEPDLDSVEITNLPEELEDVSKSVSQYFQAHFFLEFDTEPVLKARVSFLDKNGEAAANERPIADKDIDFTKAEILSFFTGEGEDSEKVEFNEVSKFVK